MQGCFIKESEEFKKIDLFFYKLFGFKKILKKMIVNDNFKILKLPKLNKKYYRKFLKFLNKEKVKEICLDNNVNKELKEFLIKEFKETEKESVFKEIFSDVIIFFAKKKGLNLNNSEIIFISSTPSLLKEYILKIYKNVKNISVITNKKEKFDKLIEDFQKDYGIFIKIKDKNEKVKKQNTIYINIEKEKFLCDESFLNVNLIDIFKNYKGAFNDIYFHYKTNSESILKKEKIVKNLSFTQFYIKNLCENCNNLSFFKEKRYKIVNIIK
ncbi:MAG: hypothetical protein IKU15_07555 [Clostridia bacterium]|nr:hypothetical protein [Clostridia bacterium]